MTAFLVCVVIVQGAYIALTVIVWRGGAVDATKANDALAAFFRRKK